MKHSDLKKIPCLSQMTETEFKSLSEILTPLSLTTGSIIFKEGDKNRDLYFAAQGKFSVKKQSSSKRLEEIAQIQAPSIIGEMAFLIQCPRSATLTVIEDAELYQLKKEDFLTLSKQNPIMAIKILEFFSGILSHRLYELDAKVCDLIAQNPTKKPAGLAELEAFRNKLTTQWSF